MEKLIIIEWYDRIIRAFHSKDGKTYYCVLIYEDSVNDSDIYVSISLDFLPQSKRIFEIIDTNRLKENWEELENLLDRIDDKNESFLIRTHDLHFEKAEIVKFKNNFNWNKNILFAEYPHYLEKVRNIENWVGYFEQL